MSVIDRFIEKSKKPRDTRGNNQSVWFFPKEKRVLKFETVYFLRKHDGHIDPRMLAFQKIAIRKAKEMGVKVPIIEKFRFRYIDKYEYFGWYPGGKVFEKYVLEEMIEGIELSKLDAKSAKQLAELPDECYDEFVDSVEKLTLLGLDVSSSEQDYPDYMLNFDENLGIYFIDLDVRAAPLNAGDLRTKVSNFEYFFDNLEIDYGENYVAWAKVKLKNAISRWKEKAKENEYLDNCMKKHEELIKEIQQEMQNTFKCIYHFPMYKKSGEEKIL